MSDDFLFYSLCTGFVLTFVLLFGLYMAGFSKKKSFIGAIIFGPSAAFIMMTIIIVRVGGV